MCCVMCGMAQVPCETRVDWCRRWATHGAKLLYIYVAIARASARKGARDKLCVLMVLARTRVKPPPPHGLCLCLSRTLCRPSHTRVVVVVWHQRGATREMHADTRESRRRSGEREDGFCNKRTRRAKRQK